MNWIARIIKTNLFIGFMYWTDWGSKPYIKHATMDGYNPKAIVDTNLGWPNGLCVDMKASRIYWADARLDRYDCLIKLACFIVLF